MRGVAARLLYSISTEVLPGYLGVCEWRNQLCFPLPTSDDDRDEVIVS